MGNTITSGVSTLTRSQKSDNSQSQTSHESSRVLFLLYLIHRTWNVVVDTVDVKGRRFYLITISSQMHLINLFILGPDRVKQHLKIQGLPEASMMRISTQTFWTQTTTNPVYMMGHNTRSVAVVTAMIRIKTHSFLVQGFGCPFVKGTFYLYFPSLYYQL